MATYFGNSDETAGSNQACPLTAWNANALEATFECPGTGAQAIVTLECFTRSYSSGSGNALMGIYTTGGELIAAATSEKARISDDTWNWIVFNAEDLTWYNSHTTLTGGTKYFISATLDGTRHLLAMTTGKPSGDYKYVATDNTAAMPDPLPAGDSGSAWPGIRCSVEDAPATATNIVMNII